MEFRQHIRTYSDGFLNSYSQIFFSQNKIFALLLLLVSFFNVRAGFSGMIAIGIGQLIAALFQFNREQIRDGSYTYNSVLVGLALGVSYAWNWSFFLLLGMASILCFFLTVAMLSVLGKMRLPYLSLPFLFTLWTVSLGAGGFYALLPATDTWYLLPGSLPGILSRTTEYIAQSDAANLLLLYFRSLGAVFFQYSDLAGILIALGLFIYSRIAFLLSVIGFLIGYAFYYFLGGDFTQLIYSYVGFNFILTAIALGGFYIVASRKSILFLFFTMPVIALLISSLVPILYYFHLPVYSLPFNMVVILTLLVIAARTRTGQLQLVQFQQFSPEKNHYKHHTASTRFGSNAYYQIALPVIGSWQVSQGYDGRITHKDDWRFALDFDIRDDEGRTYRAPGFELRDYYCYDLPVVAPAAGWVSAILDSIPDNEPGQVNLEHNWGNTLILKHGDDLYSKLSHLKKDTFKVKVGDHVSQGDIVAYCGNSGRSPEPHLHFQLQATPVIGAATLNYPLSHYLTTTNGKVTFHAFDVPQEGETVSNIVPAKLLTAAFGFIPGKTLRFRVEENGDAYEVTWEVHTSSYNQSYLYCRRSGAIAYFSNNGKVFRFTDFYGDKDSLLYHFYLGAYQVVLGYYDSLELDDMLQADDFLHPVIKCIHDLCAPFFHFSDARYAMRFVSIDHPHHPSRIELETECRSSLFGRQRTRVRSRLILEDHQIARFIIEKGSTKITALCES